LIIFSIIFYSIKYGTVYEILAKNFDESTTIIRKKSRKLWFPIYYETKIDEANISNKKPIPFFTRFWHSVFMSTSILLGLRFKKEWIHKYDKGFLLIATVEWIMGITLFVCLVILIKGSRFEYFKGFLGI
jgi:hypothetical protein